MPEQIEALRKIETDLEGACRLLPAAVLYDGVSSELATFITEFNDLLGQVWSDVSKLIESAEVLSADKAGLEADLKTLAEILMVDADETVVEVAREVMARRDALADELAAHPAPGKQSEQVPAARIEAGEGAGSPAIQPLPITPAPDHGGEDLPALLDNISERLALRRENGSYDTLEELTTDLCGHVRASLAAAAKAPAAEAVAFGNGNYVVDTGTFEGRPAVYIAPASMPGEVGASAERENHPRDALVPGEIVLTFPTPEQAVAVASAILSPTPPDIIAEVLDFLSGRKSMIDAAEAVALKWGRKQEGEPQGEAQ